MAVVLAVVVLVVVVGCSSIGNALLWPGVMEVADCEEVRYELDRWQWCWRWQWWWLW